VEVFWSEEAGLYPLVAEEAIAFYLLFLLS
jgi:hypothetical protein